MSVSTLPLNHTFIDVHFVLENKTIWWPSYVENVYTTGSLKRNTLKVYGSLVYKDLTTTSAVYKEEEGKVQFKSDTLLILLDSNGHEDCETSWRYNYIVPEAQDYKVKYCSHTAVPNSHSFIISNKLASTHGFGHTMRHQDQGEGMSLEGTTHSPTVEQDTNASAEIQDLKSRITALEVYYGHVTQQRIKELWTTRIDTFKLTLRKRVLDYMQRPLVLNRSRQKSSFSNIFQHNTIKIQIACDFQLFKILLQDIKDNYESSEQILFKPKGLSTSLPNHTTGPLQVIFRSFRKLANWFHITSEDDLVNLHFRTGKGTMSSAVSILGSTVYDPEDNSTGIDIFVGSSSSNFGQETEVQNNSSQVYRLVDKEWDSVNNRFENDFTRIHARPTVSASDILAVDSNNYFQIVWNYLPATTRSSWTADSTYTGPITLGTLTLILPSAELYGRNTISNIQYTLS